MIFKWIILFFYGYANIIVEGFFVERFINICMSKGIILQNLHREKSTILKAKILKSDFKKLKSIAKKTKCRVHIERKVGVPFILNRYRKRKVFAIALCVIAIFIFGITRFIWNIEVVGNESISKDDIIQEIKKYGIDIGKPKRKIEVEEITNAIRLERDDLSWLGIKVKGTNVIIEVVEATKKPEVIDKNKITNIVADKKGVISKMVIQSGTARVNIGDEVNPGDILVEGVMEGKYTGIRKVHSEADIFAKTYLEKEKKETFIQEIEEQTGNKEKKSEIYINNFKINFNKGVSKFENYDTIRTNKKIRLFSNYYIPIEIVKIQNLELKKYYKQFSEDELKSKIENELTAEFEEEYNISKYDTENVEKEVIVEKEDDGVKVKVIYAVQEKMGTNEEVVF